LPRPTVVVIDDDGPRHRRVRRGKKQLGHRVVGLATTVGRAPGIHEQQTVTDALDDRDVAVPEDHDVGGREATTCPRVAAPRRPGIVDDGDAMSSHMELDGVGQGRADGSVVDIAVHRMDGRTDTREQVEGLKGGVIAGMDDEIGGCQSLATPARQHPTARREMCVRDDRDAHAAIVSFRQDVVRA
jgi:hypothetical protein